MKLKIKQNYENQIAYTPLLSGFMSSILTSVSGFDWSSLGLFLPLNDLLSLRPPPTPEPSSSESLNSLSGAMRLSCTDCGNRSSGFTLSSSSDSSRTASSGIAECGRNTHFFIIKY